MFATIVSLGLAGIFVGWGLVPTEFLVLRTWISCLSALAIVWGLLYIRYGGQLPLRSDVLVMLGFSGFQLAPPLYLSIRIPYAPSVDIYDVADMYPLVALVTVLGALAFHAGYAIIKQRTPNDVSPKRPWGISPAQIGIIIALITLVVWVARGILLYNGAYYWIHVDESFLFGRWYSVTRTISDLGLILPIMLWLLMGQDRRWRFWAWLATAAEFAWVLPSGARQLMLETLFGLLLVVWWLRRRPPMKQLVILFFLAVLTLPILDIYRYTIVDATDINRISLSASVKAYHAAQERFERLSQGSYLDLADSSLRRLYDGQFLGYLLKQYRSVYDWEYGKTYLERLPFLFLPYFIYIDRPIMQVPLNDWFKLVAGGSTPTTFLGEAFLNFGYLGIFIVAFLMGMVLHLYDKFFQRRQQDILMMAIFILFSAGMPFKVNASFAGWLGYLRNAFLMALAVNLFLILLGHRKPHRR